MKKIKKNERMKKCVCVWGVNERQDKKVMNECKKEF